MKNFEIKIKVANLGDIIAAIKKMGAAYGCNMHQIDYYLRLGSYKEKIREINRVEIEKISYNRVEEIGRKESNYCIKKITPIEKKLILSQSDILCVVDKVRELWVYKHTRIHLDNVVSLGYFLELETVIKDVSVSEGLQEFQEILNILQINPQRSIASSYSDLILESQKTHPVWSLAGNSIYFKK